MPATINGTTGFGGNLTGNVTGNVTGTSSAVADGAVSAAKLDGVAKNGAGTNLAVGDPPVFGCRAWVNFNGTRNSTDTGASTNGANVLIRASGNVASVLKNGTGDYTITFTTAMPDANYATSVCSWNSAAGQGVMAEYAGSGGTYPSGKLNTSLRVCTFKQSDGAFTDSPSASVAIFR
jgi:hypothetical protein